MNCGAPIRPRFVRMAPSLRDERALTVLSERLGRHVARERLHAALAEGQAAGTTLADTLLHSGLLTPEEASTLAPDPGSCAAMVDTVVASARARREKESPAWP